MRILRRVAVAAIVLVSVLGSMLVSPAGAEQPSQVISALERDGVFIHNQRRAGIDPDALAATVAEADRLGYTMAVIVPNDPLPELRSFVKRIQQGGEYDIVIGFGEDGVVEAETSEDLGSSRIGALRVVRDSEGSTEEMASLFLTELTAEPTEEIPPFVWRVIRWVGILLAVLVVAGILEQLIRTFSKRGRRTPAPDTPTQAPPKKSSSAQAPSSETVA